MVDLLNNSSYSFNCCRSLIFSSSISSACCFSTSKELIWIAARSNRPPRLRFSSWRSVFLALSCSKRSRTSNIRSLFCKSQMVCFNGESWSCSIALTKASFSWTTSALCSNFLSSNCIFNATISRSCLRAFASTCITSCCISSTSSLRDLVVCSIPLWSWSISDLIVSTICSCAWRVCSKAKTCWSLDCISISRSFLRLVFSSSKILSCVIISSILSEFFSLDSVKQFRRLSISVSLFDDNADSCLS